MKIIISANTLLKNLTALSGVINNSNTLPILDNFLFNFGNNKLFITASDLETTMTVELKNEVNEKGNFAIPAKLLIDVLKTLPDQPLTFTFLENNVVEISSQSGKYEVAYYPGEEYPKAIVVENPSSTVIPSKVLATAIAKTINSTSNDELKPILTGVLFQLKTDRIVFVATDAHKLVKYCRTDLQSTEDFSFIMPKKPLNVLKSILSTLNADVKIEFNINNALFIFENFVLCCRLVEGNYPDYERVIPKENPNKLIIDRVQLLNSVNCVSIFSSKETHQIRLKLSGQELQLSADDAQFSNRGNERLTCNYEGDDLEIGFNSKFLAEMIKNISSDEVQIEMSQPNRAGVLTPNDGLSDGEEILMLVMPSLIQ